MLHGHLPVCDGLIKNIGGHPSWVLSLFQGEGKEEPGFARDIGILVGLGEEHLVTLQLHLLHGFFHTGVGVVFDIIREGVH